MKLVAPTVVMIDVAVLVALRPDPAVLGRLSAPRSWIRADGADAVLVQVAGDGLWLVAAWVALGLFAAAAAHAPGHCGRLGRRISFVVLPRVLRQVLVGSAGLGVLLAPAVAQARSHWVPPVQVDTTVAGVDPLPAPTWPVTGSHPTNSTAPPETPPTKSPRPGTPRPSVPGPSWPGRSTPPGVPVSVPDVEHPSDVSSEGPRTGPRSTPTPSADTPPRVRTHIHAEPPSSSQQSPTTPVQLPRPSTSNSAAADHARVNSGDSLWLVAAHRLGPSASEQSVAQYWPRIYAANRPVIGDDPDLIQPGQRLTLPMPKSQETP